MYLKLALAALLGLLVGAFASEQALSIGAVAGVVVALLCVVYLLWPRGSNIVGGNAILPLIYVIVICGVAFLAHSLSASIDWPWAAFQIDGFTVLR